MPASPRLPHGTALEIGTTSRTAAEPSDVGNNGEATIIDEE